MDVGSFTRSGAWSFVDEGEGIGRLVLDLPGEKVNKLTTAVLEDLEKILTRLANSLDVRALIVANGKEGSSTFIAGADINEIRAVDDVAQATQLARRGQDVLDLLSSTSMITVAAIHGNCLGGGTELVLACDFRVASLSDKTKIGLPEVQLGIIPGFGGTQRLPRLVGISRSLPMILTGQPVDARRAGRMGLVDKVVYPGLLLKEAKELACEALHRGGKKFRPRSRRRLFSQRFLETVPGGRALIRWSATKSITAKTGGHYPAPLKALDSVLTGYGQSLARGLKTEAAIVGELVVAEHTKNMIDLFLARESARRVDDQAGTAPAGLITERRVGVLGAGVMGGGIVALLARKGFRVRMKDIQSEAISLGLRKIHDSFETLVRKRRLTKAQQRNLMSSITTSLDDSGFSRIGAVIEAVVEKMEVKQDVFRKLEEFVPDDALLCSNTSALSVTEMQSVLKSPGRFVGLHFFNPVHRMPLVEVIPGERSSEEYVVATENFARHLGKIPVRVADRPGFLVNRLLGCYLNEAAHLFVEGCSPMAVDGCMKSFGMPMGPFELLDEVGLDVAAKVAATLHEGFGDRLQPPAVVNQLVERGQLLGKKSGAGFYIYNGRRKTVNPKAVLFGGATDASFKPDQPDLWTRRLIYTVINEAARALDEGVVSSPELLDLAMVMGTGFAPFRGGPLRYGDSIGVATVCEGLQSFGPDRLKPCETVQRLARDKAKFYDLGKKDLVHAGGAR